MKNQLLILLLLPFVACTSSKHSTAPTKNNGSADSRLPGGRSVSRSFENKGPLPSSKNDTPSTRFLAPNVTSTNVETREPLTPLMLQFKYAILLDVPFEEISDLKMFFFIDSWYGVKYKYGGTDRSGIDCSAFARSFMDSIFNILLPRTSTEQYRRSKRIKKNQLQEGDLVFFYTRGRKAGITHVGVFLRNNKFVHASIGGGVMIDDLSEDYYAKRYAGAGRVTSDLTSQ